MNDLDLQREVTVKIVGTNYDEYARNYRNLRSRQRLVMARRIDSGYDKNAVMILTDDNRELGFLPAEYASLYATAIDNRKYEFIVEVEKVEPDPNRPTLYVRIISEYRDINEQEVESNILKWVQRFADGLLAKQAEYLDFIKAETVDVSALVSVLSEARLFRDLCLLSEPIIKENNVRPNGDNFRPFITDDLIKGIDEIKIDISEILKKYRKIYNESIDIDDEEKFQKVQSESREKIKKFRFLNDLCESLKKSIQDNKPVSLCGLNKANNNTSSESAEIHKNEYDKKGQNENSLVNASDDTISVQAKANEDLSEKAFANWLVEYGAVSETTAKLYISNIHAVEKMYFKLFGEKRQIIGAESKETVQETIDVLTANAEYIDANDRRRNGFNAALIKFADFADIEFKGMPKRVERPEKSASAGRPVVKRVDIANPYDITGHKPVSFSFLGKTEAVRSWKDVYYHFLTKLYSDDSYRALLMSYINRSFYGSCIDFADNSVKSQLRYPVRISEDFYAEANLSSCDTIKRIGWLLKKCGLSYDSVVIEYNSIETVGQIEDAVKTDDFVGGYAEKEANESADDARVSFSDSFIPNEECNENAQEDNISFRPDVTEPFELKKAVIAILSSNAPEINRLRGYKNGMSSIALQGAIKSYYNKKLSIFEISKLLITDKMFLSVGKGSFIIAPSASVNIDISDEDDLPCDNSPVTSDYRDPADKRADSENLLPNKPLAGSDTFLHDKIIEIIVSNKDNLQYEDGFGGYEIKNLLLNEGIKDISEDEIEEILSGSAELVANDEGYYTYKNAEDALKPVITESSPTANETDVEREIKNDDIPIRSDEINGTGVFISLNGRTFRAFDYSDALCKVCEFAIEFKPFAMARIAGSGIQYDKRNVFYRVPTPVNGCKKLSNGLQVLDINDLNSLKAITEKVKSYCQIDDMIRIL